jgi:uncharacterized membrane protein
MKLSNPLEMNDWRISSFMLFSFSVLALLWIAFILNAGGVQIPLIQQVAGCICLLFIPGIAVLRIIRWHKLGSVETPLYAVGISISVVIFAGLLLNEIAPLVGINDPLSALHLILAMSVVTIALCAASYLRDKDFASPTQLYKGLLTPAVLSLLLLPFLSIFGAYLVNNYEINWLIMLMLICVGVVVLVVGSRKSVNRSIYPLAIFVISLSLLLSNTLISRYLWGWDVLTEARIVSSVVSSSVWNPSYDFSDTVTLVGRYNPVLSLSMLGPALSQIGNIDITSLFKIVYPVIFSLVPVALYQLFRKQTSDIVAFLASFYVVTTATFFLEVPEFARQEIAELSLALALLLIFTKTNRTSTKGFVLVLLSGTLVVSHYGITWLFMIQLIAVLILLFLADSNFLRRVARRIVGSTPALEATADRKASTSSIRELSALSATFVVLFAAMAFAWYVYTDNALLVADLFHSSATIAQSDLVSYAGTQAARTLQPAQTLLETIQYHLSQGVALLLILLGVIAAFVQRKTLAFDKTFFAFAVTSFGLAILVLEVPVLFPIWNSSRLWQFSMLILAPFLILGVMTLFLIPRLITKTRGGCDLESKAYPAAAVFLVILLLFNTGFIYTLAQQPVLYSQLSPSLEYQDLPMFAHVQDLAGARWLSSVSGGDPVYADSLSQGVLLAYSNLSIGQFQRLYNWTTTLRPNSVIYVCSSEATATEWWTNPQTAALVGWPVIQSPRFTGNMSKIYDSGCAIYSTPAT